MSSYVTCTGRAYLQDRIRKANAAFLNFYKVWGTWDILIKTELRIFTMKIKSVCLYDGNC